MEFKNFGGLEFTTATLVELKRWLSEGKELFGRSIPGASISTGSLSLDRATGVGGLPRGQLVLVTGTSFEHSKALALAMVSAVQGQGGLVVVLDAGERLWSSLSDHTGIREEQLAFLRVESPLDALEAVRVLAQAGLVDLVLMGPLVDADFNDTPTEFVTPDGATGAGLQSKLRTLTHELKGGRTTVVTLDSGRQSASPITAAGRLQNTLEDLIGMKVSTRPAKGRDLFGGIMGEGGRLTVDVARSGTWTSHSTMIDIEPGGRVSKAGDLLEYGLSEGYIQRRGSIYEMADGVTLGRGRQAAKRTIDYEADLGLSLESMAERGLELQLQDYAVEVEPTEPSSPEDLALPGGFYHGEPDSVEAEEQGDGEAADTFSMPDGKPEPATESTDPGTPSPRSGKPPSRFLNTWFDGTAEPLMPLVVGEWYDFKFQIGKRRGMVPGGGAATFTEPDFGSHSSIELLVTLYSLDFQVTERNHHLTLEKVGDTRVSETSVSPLHVGCCTLRLVVSLRHELEILQSLLVEIEAVELAGGE